MRLRSISFALLVFLEIISFQHLADIKRHRLTPEYAQTFITFMMIHILYLLDAHVNTGM